MNEVIKRKLREWMVLLVGPKYMYYYNICTLGGNVGRRVAYKDD